MENSLVSIVIPVYNVEKYLRQCLDSAINQTYKNLEIFLVDDGSTDRSGQICDEYKKIDDRIIVIHKENGGLSSARNAALDLLKGKYIYFLDSDDFAALDMIETRVKFMEDYNVDIVMGTDYSFYGEIENSTKHILFDNKPEVFTRIEAIKLMFLNKKLYHDAAGPLYKSVLFKEIRFPIGMLYEDFATSYYVVSNANKVLWIDDRRQFYRLRVNSIMHSMVTERDMVIFDIAEKVMHDMVELYPEVKCAAIRQTVVTFLKFYSRILYTGFNSFKNEQKRIRDCIDKYGKTFIKSGYATNNDIIKLFAFRMGKLPFYLIYRFSDYIQLKRKSI